MSDDETKKGNTGSENLDRVDGHVEGVEPRFDVSAAALGALDRSEEAEVHAAAAVDQSVSAELAEMEAVAAQLAWLAPVQVMNRGRSAGIRSRLVARAAGTHVGRPASRVSPPLVESESRTVRHQTSKAPGSRPAASSSPRNPTVVPAAGGPTQGPHQKTARFVPFEPASRVGLERVMSMVALAAVLVIAAFGLYNWRTRASGPASGAKADASKDSSLEAQVASLRATVGQKDSLIAALTGARTRVIDLIGYNSVDPMARVFWDQKTQTFIMYASHVKHPPAGKTYQVWLIARGVVSPVSAGTFMPDSAGSAIMATRHPMEPGTLRRIAVTEEPVGGMPTPTGPIVFAGVGK